MAQAHKGVAILTLGIVGAGLVGATVIKAGWDTFGWGSKEKEPAIVSAPFKVEYGDETQAQPEPKEAPEPKRHLPIREQPQPTRTQSAYRKPSLTEKWLDKVNQGGMLAFGEDNGYTGVGNSNGECSTLQPLRVRAMIADSATTDDPGTAFGIITEDVQGQFPDGEYCVAIHESAVVSFHVEKAGDYASNRAPTKVGEIWMEDGFKITVNQPAKHIDGSLGVVGKANHHVMSKTFAAIVGGGFRFLDNITRIGQSNISSGDVTDPFQKMIDRRLNRPAEITFTGGKVAEFDLMPVSTPGY